MPSTRRGHHFETLIGAGTPRGVVEGSQDLSAVPQRPGSNGRSIGGSVSLSIAADFQTSKSLAALVCARGRTLRSELSCSHRRVGAVGC